MMSSASDDCVFCGVVVWRVKLLSSDDFVWSANHDGSRSITRKSAPY